MMRPMTAAISKTPTNIAPIIIALANVYKTDPIVLIAVVDIWVTSAPTTVYSVASLTAVSFSVWATALLETFDIYYMTASAIYSWDIDLFTVTLFPLIILV